MFHGNNSTLNKHEPYAMWNLNIMSNIMSKCMLELLIWGFKVHTGAVKSRQNPELYAPLGSA